MTPISITPSWWEAAGTVVAAGCAVYVTWRDRTWRKGEVWSGLLERITRAERWHESPEGKAMSAEIRTADGRITVCEGRLDNTATTEDVAELKGLIGRVESTSNDTKAGVDRIEGMLMQRALGVER